MSCQINGAYSPKIKEWWKSEKSTWFIIGFVTCLAIDTILLIFILNKWY